MAKHWRFGYTIFRGLSTGVFRPLLCWSIACAIVIIFLVLGSNVTGLSWTQVVGAFLDPGVFGGIDYDVSKVGILGQVALLLISLLSVFCVSALLVSMITNTFSNITYKFHNGDFRRSLNDYVLIIGSGDNLHSVLAQVARQNKPIVIFSATNPGINNYEYYFYRGNKTCIEDIRTIGIEKADSIYVISDRSIMNDDANCLACLDILRDISKMSTKSINCYVIINDFTTSEVLAYSQNNTVESSNLFLVDIINANEYIAEQLLLNSDILPVIKMEDDANANIVIFGAGNLARGVAYTIAHICHYPKRNGQLRKTRITIMDSQVEQLENTFISSRVGLFELSSYTTINAAGQRKEHHPTKDFLDVEWEFVALSPESGIGQQFLQENALRPNALVRYIVCPNDETMTMQYTMHLPRLCYDSPIAVYVKDTEVMVNRANQTHMYGHLIPFGFSNQSFDSNLLIYRSEMGQRVNFLYDQAYNNPPSKTKEIAWYKLSEPHKLSSIYCGLAIPLRERCFDNDIMAKAESEHRRWMLSILLIGNFSADKTDKKRFLHQDIIPFEDLPDGEKSKDIMLLEGTEYILNGRIAQ